MQKLFFTYLILGGTLSQIFSQDKVSLAEGAYFQWKSIEKTSLSDDGQWLVYELNPNKGDGKLIVRSTHDDLKVFSIDRAKNAHIDPETSILSCLVSPPQVVIDSLKRKKIKDKDLPCDTLLLLDLSSKEKSIIPSIKALKNPEKWGGWIFYTLDTDRDSLLQKQLSRKLQKEEFVLVVQNLKTLTKDTLAFIQSYDLAEETPVFYINQNAPDSSKKTSIHYFNLLDDHKTLVYDGVGQVKNLKTTKDGQILAFLADPDTSHHMIPLYEQFIWKVQVGEPIRLATSADQTLPNDWIISEHFNNYFSPDKQKLFLGLTPMPILRDTTLLPDEIVEVEIWNYQDEILYTQQEVQEKEERNRSYLSVYDLAENALIPLGRPSIPTIKPHEDLELEWVIGLDDLTKQKARSWEGKIYKDLYLISTVDGSAELLRTNINGSPTWSPAGKYIFWYEDSDTTWYLYSLPEERLINLTNHHPRFSDELNDQPDYPNSYGLMGWSQNDEKVYLYDRYDIWEFNPSELNSPIRITKGREKNLEYRYVSLDQEEKYLPPGEWLIRGFNQVSKAEEYNLFDSGNGEMRNLLEGNFRLDRTPIKAKKSDEIIFTRESFEEFPDLYLCKGFNFSAARKMTSANKQQENYLWGQIELVSWTSFDGQKLEGLLVTPEGFDSTRKYPMIVNFYERSSDNLHAHHAPAPGRSTINYSYYASNGYVIFNPDIVYTIGYPGESAYNAVVSGTRAIIDMGFIDTARIALQGHSWGGYQIAHILTKTNLFACAESGAPVVNMISAYGGIRWGTGLSRMFQYEHTQSRLGATLWQQPDLYLENSPIFNVDKIETPVLILHNDEDSAVPWYQGIEFFVAMRRLNKPAWLLNYNGEPHWPVKWQNRLDFNRRLFQFFEHFLKDAPMPVWMKQGVRAVDKGIDTGLELTPGEDN